MFFTAVIICTFICLLVQLRGQRPVRDGLVTFFALFLVALIALMLGGHWAFEDIRYYGLVGVAALLATFLVAAAIFLYRQRHRKSGGEDIGAR